MEREVLVNQEQVEAEADVMLSATAASGGSGKVILRLSTSKYSGTQSGATVTTDGTNTVLTWTGAGSYTA
jgi:hypothetical protein